MGSNRTAGLEVNAEKMKYVFMAGQQSAGRSHNLKINNENCGGDKVKYLGKTPPNEN